MIVANDFNSIYKGLIREVLCDGKKESPRGIATREITPYVFTLTDPSQSLLTLKARKLAYDFNAAEKLCYITGNSGENILPKYAPKISRFINPKTALFDGSYGPRLIQQYKYILDLLRKDPNTRQATLNINNFHDDMHIGYDSLDIPCTQNIQFLLRQNKLHCVVTMRSNDLLWGLPYDISQFTFLQECFANLLGVELGHYTHFVGSLHVYETDVARFMKILSSDELVDEKYFQQPVNVETYEQLMDQSKMTLHNDIYPNSHEFSQPLVPYFKQLHEIIHETKSNSVNVKC